VNQSVLTTAEAALNGVTSCVENLTASHCAPNPISWMYGQCPQYTAV